MADQITMAKYWHQYQAAEIKANRARVELEKLKNTMQHSAGSEDLMEAQTESCRISQGRVVYTLGITHQQKIRAARKRPSW